MKRGGDKSERASAASRGVSPVSAPSTSLITLLTDFGTSDYFVPAMKGVILGTNPKARIVDITHDIPPHDIEAAAFTLLAVYQAFPVRTVHVAVVDPGVGSSRRPILVRAAGQAFVGPDNGIFSYIYDREPDHRVFHLNNDRYFRQPVSATFHGRDIFSPVAARISKGMHTSDLGAQIGDYTRMESLDPVKLDHKRLSGRIIHIDHFGNCITNFTERDLESAGARRLIINGTSIKSFKRFFAETTGAREKLFGIVGSTGYLEIAAENASAAKLLKAKRGQLVVASS